MKTKPTVIVVDPDSATRDSVSSLARMMNLECEAYASGTKFLEDYDPDTAGCLVLEIRIPDLNGVQIQERLSREGSLLPIIFLTGQATVSIAVRAMRSGALHVIEKPFREHELWDAIEEAVKLNERQRHLARGRRDLEERLARLSAEEQALLTLVAQGEPKKATAAELGVSVRTVELRRSRLMRKLGFEAPIELMQFALAASDEHFWENGSLLKGRAGHNGYDTP